MVIEEIIGQPVVFGRAERPTDPQQEKIFQCFPAVVPRCKIFGIKRAVHPGFEFLEDRLEKPCFGYDKTVKVPVIHDVADNVFVARVQKSGRRAEINMAGHSAIIAQAPEIHSLVAVRMGVQKATHGSFVGADKPQVGTMVKIPHGAIPTFDLFNHFLELKNRIHGPRRFFEMAGARSQHLQQGMAGSVNDIVQAAAGAA